MGIKMVSYNFINCDEKELIAIKELQKLFPFNIAQEGIPVEIGRTDAGLTLAGTRKGIQLQYSRLNTLFRGLYLLFANIENENLNIKQECSFQDMGMMMDMSRNAVMTVETIKDMVRHLAALGYHSIQLYTEDTMEVEGEEYFGHMRGALKKNEIKEIDDYCKLFGIELIPCIQCLAHLNQITRYERYDKIIDTADILMVGEEETYVFLEKILQTAAGNYTSRKINIGMDEADMVGLGKYLNRNGYSDRFDIMINHLNRVIELCHKYDFHPQMWSDMFFRLVSGGEYHSVGAETKSAELFDKIPKDVRLIYWDYYSLDHQIYYNKLKHHLNITDHVGFAGGAWKWTGFAPDNQYSIRTGADSVRACKDLSIDNFLLTSWADNGAEASIYSILPSIYYYAEHAYSDHFIKNYFKTLTGVAFDDYMAIDLPNRLFQSDVEHNNASKFFFYNDILIGTFDSLVLENMEGLYEKHANKLKNVSKQAGRYGYIFKTLQKLCEVLAIKTELGMKLKRAYDAHDIQRLEHINKEILTELIIKIKDFYESLSDQWHKENKSFGFEVQCIRIGGLINRVEYVQKRLGQFIDGEIPKIEELETERKPFSYYEVEHADQLIYNRWDIIVTPSAL